jgi:glyoxylase-like metal-dependent hydrolase (beta-lactamase superfamily II)
MKKIITALMITITTLTYAQENHKHDLPQTAIGAQIPYPKGYLVEEINNGLYQVTDGLYNGMFLVYDKGVIAVDAPPTIGENYLKAIAEVTKKPVTHLIYSHSHTDHIGGSTFFPKGIEIIAQKETYTILKKRNDPRRRIPTKFFDTKLIVKKGNQELVLEYHGKNHMDGNIFIYAPKQKTLMVVDIIFPGWVPFKNLGIAEDVPAFIDAHDIVLNYNFETLVAGHVTRLGNRKDVEVAKKFVLDLKATCQQAFGKIDFMKSALETGFDDKWKMYNTYFEKVVEAARSDMHTKWNGKLGGLDTYLKDDCWVMCESLSVDFGTTK